MNQPISEMDALRWLNEAAASEPEVPPEVQARVVRHVSTSLGGFSGGRFGAHSAGATQTRSTPVTRYGREQSGNWQRVLASRLAAWSAPALVVGAALGAAGHAAWVKEKTHTVYIDRVMAASPVPPTPNTTQQVDAPSIAVESLPLEFEARPLDESGASTHGASTGRPSAASAESHDSSALSRERAVLDPARAALASGEPARALEHVRRHSRQFPNGILSEEREAIAINALVTLGKYAEATQRAVVFRMRYPQSLMMYSVDAALATMPK